MTKEEQDLKKLLDALGRPGGTELASIVMALAAVPEGGDKRLPTQLEIILRVFMAPISYAFSEGWKVRMRPGGIEAFIKEDEFKLLDECKAQFDVYSALATSAAYWLGAAGANEEDVVMSALRGLAQMKPANETQETSEIDPEVR